MPSQPSPLPTESAVTFEIVRTFPHDPLAFTQGLAFDQGVLYEGTGLRGRSSLRRVDLASGRILAMTRLPDRYFGEGITVWQDRIFQLTWQAGLGLIYDKNSLDLLDRFYYSTPGWGLTHDRRFLILSDGSERLYFIDPIRFKVTRSCRVQGPQGYLEKLNELEMVRGEVWANVWQKDIIARINPADGRVKGLIDLSGLRKFLPGTPPDRVLNGIAYDEEHDRLLVTGKLWPQIFEIRIKPR